MTSNRLYPSLGPAPTRPPRTPNFSPKQHRILVDTFEEDNKPSLDRRRHLATLFGVPSRMLRIWFKNTRQRQRHDFQQKKVPRLSPVFALDYYGDDDEWPIRPDVYLPGKPCQSAFF
ncbi:homeobox protein [Stygiomarasmius scandens]|uniref:Homeobox protein n=1 Tax=Marasmiellus scandens TaxID=2682957 RepID=A0ABR1IRT1_9AGAR